MKPQHALLIFGLMAGATPAVAQETPLFPQGEKAANVHHTGDVWLSHVSEADQTFDYSVAQAIFAPGAKLDWHVHPAGQQLLITQGTGYYQERGQPVQIVRKGDVIKCLPGVEHWHAATPNTSFAYLGLTGNQPTQWLEPVAEEAYRSILPSTASNSDATQELIQLSRDKWQWMAAKNVDKLSGLFHPKAQFVHMGGSWGTEQELSIIKSGGIWYKKADIHEVSVNVIDQTDILLNRIDLLAEVGGNEVTNPFMVTEVYVKENGSWKLGSLSFTRLLTPER
ncbi:Cupin domain protein [Catalinimonas alkaloidigena]|uniref:Cupin domain protein n=1 Tax=Catalinimonas alkaloidigena TaxID=1075417 RepID=A0A1G9UE97_9BACT|nr:DUF4440 domain-containing protein [Catalinimonas alkaloidigena]SDM58277.1 Cupin domain protein [Catalinimonas alkaloidigena]